MPFIVAAADHSPITHVVPHRLFPEDGPLYSVNVGGGDIPALNIKNGVYDFYITNHLMMTAVSAIAVILVFAYVALRVRPKGEGLNAYETKGRLSQMFETMAAFIRDEVARPNLGSLTDKYIYYIWTVFFFILFCNVLGLIPLGYILQSITGNPQYAHYGGTATGNLSLNLMLASASFVAILFIGIRETGVKAFFAHFNPVGWDDPKMLLIGIPLYILEWVGLMIKTIVLAMRLFGTMMAGHLVIAAFVGLVTTALAFSTTLGFGVGFAVVFGGAALTLLELFICFLQAFIFTFLTVLFISMTAAHHDDHHDDPTSDEGRMDLDKLADPKRITPLAPSH